MAGLNPPGFPAPGIPRPYRGRGNRGKTPAIPQRDKTGITGKDDAGTLDSLVQENTSLKRQLRTLARLAGAALARLPAHERMACLKEAQR